jgi:hypothetical protein
MRPIRSPSPDCHVSLLLLCHHRHDVTNKTNTLYTIAKNKKVSESKNIIVAIDKILLV